MVPGIRDSSLAPFRFCPGCGHPGPVTEDDRSILCGKCGFHFFFNAAAAVAGLIEDAQGRLLFVVRAQNPKKGSLDLPGGFVDFDESAEEAVRREIREELNLNLSRCSYFASRPNTYTFDNITYHTLDLSYICTAENLEDMTLSPEVERIEFRAPEEIELDRVGFDSIRDILFRYLHARFSLPPCTI
jgi:ADP-ribose pyrophosphatase YjhB (NUDIX family)